MQNQAKMAELLLARCDEGARMGNPIRKSINFSQCYQTAKLSKAPTFCSTNKPLRFRPDCPMDSLVTRLLIDQSTPLILESFHLGTQVKYTIDFTPVDGKPSYNSEHQTEEATP
jgi:hypothetical protein